MDIVGSGSGLTFDLSWCGVAWVTCCVKCLLTLLINDHVIKKKVVFYVYALLYEGDKTIKLHKELNIVMESTRGQAW